MNAFEPLIAFALVRRVLLFIGLLGIVVGLLSTTLHALTDEQKKEMFLKAREEMKTVPGAQPKPGGAGHSKPQPIKRPTPSPTATPTPTPPQKETPEPRPTPERKATPTPTPTPAPTPTPHATATPVPGSQGQQGHQAPVVIQKSGYEGVPELEPTPTPEPRRGLFSWLFGPEPTYRYLSRSVRLAIDKAPVQKRRWRYIVVHNSGSRQGNAAIFDYYHRHTRKMPNGLAYHFVIGNGTSSGDGQIEIGGRWTRQINGGHVHSDYLNNIALGICLVGDYNRDLPTKAQLEALDELIRYLRKRVGKIDRKVAIVKPHKEINPPQWPTDCPGDRFPIRWLHQQYD